MIIRAEDLLSARILIVDDEPVNVRLLERTLLSEGFTCLKCTTDSRQTHSLIAEFKPNLILLDLQMPHVDGFEVLKDLESDKVPGEYLPVLVLTADVTSQAKHRALSSGAK